MASAATISDVAKMAGVSIKTVSRVVNREPNVRQNTRDRVLKAIQALNYKPSLAARGLAGGRTFLIGMLFDNASDSFLGDLQRGILAACSERHYGLALCPAPNPTNRVSGLMDWIVSTQPDGLILTPPLSDDRELVERLIQADQKFISVSSSGTGLGPAVYIDERAAARAMAQHLIDAGYRKIGFIKGPTDHACSALRYQGFLEALEAAKLELTDDWVASGAFDFESGVTAGEYLLDRADRPEVVFASNDEMAAGIMHVAYRLGLSVPVDLAVAGFDDTPIAERFWPGLSTVKQPIGEIGRLATEQLMQMITPKNHKAAQGEAEERPSGNTELPFELVLRASTDPSAGG